MTILLVPFQLYKNVSLFHIIRDNRSVISGGPGYGIFFSGPVCNVRVKNYSVPLLHSTGYSENSRSEIINLFKNYFVKKL